MHPRAIELSYQRARIIKNNPLNSTINLGNISTHVMLRLTSSTTWNPTFFSTNLEGPRPLQLYIKVSKYQEEFTTKFERQKRKEKIAILFLYCNQFWIHEQELSEQLSFTLSEVRAISLLKALLQDYSSGPISLKIKSFRALQKVQHITITAFTKNSELHNQHMEPN